LARIKLGGGCNAICGPAYVGSGSTARAFFFWLRVLSCPKHCKQNKSPPMLRQASAPQENARSRTVRVEERMSRQRPSHKATSKASAPSTQTARLPQRIPRIKIVFARCKKCRLTRWAMTAPLFRIASRSPFMALSNLLYQPSRARLGCGKCLAPASPLRAREPPRAPRFQGVRKATQITAMHIIAMMATPIQLLPLECPWGIGAEL